MNKTELLGKLSTSPEERLVLARAMDKLDLAQNRGVPLPTADGSWEKPEENENEKNEEENDILLGTGFSFARRTY